jgi:hypothetical protein
MENPKWMDLKKKRLFWRRRPLGVQRVKEVDLNVR